MTCLSIKQLYCRDSDDNKVAVNIAFCSRLQSSKWSEHAGFFLLGSSADEVMGQGLFPLQRSFWEVLFA